MIVFTVLSIFNLYNLTNDYLTLEYENVLNEDHNILFHNHYHFNLEKLRKVQKQPQQISPTIYWQCFARKDTSVELTDLGYSEDLENKKENYSLIKISATDQNNNTHRYIMRRAWPIDGYQQYFNEWLSLMKSQKYVCLAGSFIDKEKENNNHIVYYWQFEKIKTKKGCSSYFEDKRCHSHRG